jgi:hypothetical protein
MTARHRRPAVNDVMDARIDELAGGRHPMRAFNVADLEPAERIRYGFDAAGTLKPARGKRRGRR